MKILFIAATAFAVTIPFAWLDKQREPDPASPWQFPEQWPLHTDTVSSPGYETPQAYLKWVEALAVVQGCGRTEGAQDAELEAVALRLAKSMWQPHENIGKIWYHDGQIAYGAVMPLAGEGCPTEAEVQRARERLGEAEREIARLLR